MISWRDFLTWIEGSALGNSIRDSGVWTYGVVNLIHIVGIATLFGSVLALDLRLLGWRRHISLSTIASVTTPVAAIGFGIAFFSGVCLLATNATEYVGNPFIPIKFTAIALGLFNVVVMSRLPAWRLRTGRDSDVSIRASTKSEVQLAVLGGMSLLCWLTALSAGRMIGYW